MILFGAGSSIPFNIPGMKGFTDQFMKREESPFLAELKKAVSLSKEKTGMAIPFDLETLLSILGDLSGETVAKPISTPTFSFLLSHNITLSEAIGEHGKEASTMLESLRYFIFDTCMGPIRKGEIDGSLDFLHHFYGPLMTVLNKGNLRGIQDQIKPVYSTNWDLCFKTWVRACINGPINDGTGLDKQSQPVLEIDRLGDTQKGFAYVPLHGCYDFFKISRPRASGTYKAIQKMPDPIRYFEDKPARLRDVFMIYPLEAIGYEESVKSPYLDMLSKFRSTLMTEFIVFIIGYSLRDPTIGSILEEVVTERIRKGDLNVLSPDFTSRKQEAANNQFKIVVISPNFQELSENLKKQNHTNLLGTFVPIEIRFPRLEEKDFKKKYMQVLKKLIDDLRAVNFLDNQEVTNLVGTELQTEFRMDVRRMRALGQT